MSSPPLADQPKPARRRWLRISLRTLLVVVTVLAVWSGWYANRALRQRQAVASIVAQGGKVVYASQRGSGETPRPLPFLAQYLGADFVESVSYVYFIGPEFDDTDLILLNDLRTTTWLVLHDCKVTGSGFYEVPSLRELRKLHATRTPLADHGIAYFRGSKLQMLSIIDTAITDDGFENLAHCQSLETLFVHDMPISDRGVKHLAGLDNLSNIRFWGTQITDQALLVFADHPGLIELKFWRCAITDEGLKLLGKPPKLEYLQLEDTRVTPEGCARIKALYGGKLNVQGPRATPPDAAPSDSASFP